jgi:predicted TIM-barrel fold metal-dependent hydrolase
VFPTGHGDVPYQREQIAELIDHRSGAAVLRPEQDGWSTAEWCAGALLGLLEERRIPVLCRDSAFAFEAVADLAERHSDLPIVVFHVGFRSQRTLVPLMRAFGNLYLAIGSPFSVHLGIESMARHVGPERVLFGTGFPYAEPMAAITMLTYSDLSDADKQLVGAANLDRLIGGIRR